MLVAALVGGTVVAGCGSSSTSSSSSQATSTAVPTTSAQQTVEACKQRIQTQKTILPGVRTKLEAVCEQEASGNRTALRLAAHEACVELVKVSSASASVKKRELAGCKIK